MRISPGHMVTLLVLTLITGVISGCKDKKAAPQPATMEKPQGQPVAETDRGRRTIQVFKAYQKDVVGSLKAALTGGGTVAAITVCKEVAAGLKERFRDMPEVTVRRVAQRYRNADHVPDAFETAIFKEWEDGMAEGTPPIAIARATEAGLRVMQPIMLGSRLCLRCHGKPRDMTSETVETLQRLYPNDNATNFEMGDLRGAFSAIWHQAPAATP